MYKSRYVMFCFDICRWLCDCWEMFNLYGSVTHRRHVLMFDRHGYSCNRTLNTRYIKTNAIQPECTFNRCFARGRRGCIDLWLRKLRLSCHHISSISNAFNSLLNYSGVESIVIDTHTHM